LSNDAAHGKGSLRDLNELCSLGVIGASARNTAQYGAGAVDVLA